MKPDERASAAPRRAGKGGWGNAETVSIRRRWTDPDVFADWSEANRKARADYQAHPTTRFCQHETCTTAVRGRFCGPHGQRWS